MSVALWGILIDFLVNLCSDENWIEIKINLFWNSYFMCNISHFKSIAQSTKLFVIRDILIYFKILIFIRWTRATDFLFFIYIQFSLFNHNSYCQQDIQKDNSKKSQFKLFISRLSNMLISFLFCSWQHKQFLMWSHASCMIFAQE